MMRLLFLGLLFTFPKALSAQVAQPLHLRRRCYGWGHKSVEILLDRIVNNKSPDSDRIIDPLTRVTKENADEWAQKWQKWLGK